MIKHPARILIVGMLLLLTSCGGGSGVTSDPEEQPPLSQNVVTLELSGVELQALTTAPQNSVPISDTCTISLIQPKEVLRRIDPGDIPNSTSARQPVIIDENSLVIAGQLSDQAMLLQVVFAPAINLITGEPNGADGNPRLFAVHVPLRHVLPREALVKVEVDIGQDAGGDYFSDTRATFSCQGLENVKVTRLDYADGLVSQDSDLDGDFRDEAWLADEGRLGISQNLVEKLTAINQLGVGQPVSAMFTGKLVEVDEPGGKLHLSDACWFANTGRMELGDIEVGFTEEARFATRLVSLAGEQLINKAASYMPIEQMVTFEAEILTGNSTTQIGDFWASHLEELILDFPHDAIAAVPLKTTAMPGEPVTFTVYANQTANPFYELNRVRVAFETGNEYLAGSLNAGDRGGEATSADGIWAGMKASQILLPDESQRAISSADGEVSYLDFELKPISGEPVSLASGALFNFKLICNENLSPRIYKSDGGELVTYYSDNQDGDYTWENTVSDSPATVSVGGGKLRLSLADPPPLEHPQTGYPHLVDAGTSWELCLIDPIFGDVANHPDANYEIFTTGDMLQLSIEDGFLTIGESFEGRLRIQAEFNGIYSGSSRPKLFVDSTRKFSLNIHEKQTYVFGGSARDWELEFDPQPESMNVWVIVHDAVDLVALFLDLKYDPDLYRLKHIREWEAMDIGEGLERSSDRMVNKRRHMGIGEHAQVLLHPQRNTGVSGTHALLAYKFDRMPEDSDAFELSLPDCKTAILEWDDERNTLIWAYALYGDYNQNGFVYDCDEDGPELSDFTILSMYLYEGGPYGGNSIQDVIDSVGKDGNELIVGDDRIFDHESSEFFDHNFEKIEGWHIHAGPGGAVVGYVPFTDLIGDYLVERIHFEWTPPSIEPGTTYWVCPVLNGEEGVPSNEVTVP